MPPLFPRRPARGRVPLLNSACPWASTKEDLETLWANPYTDAMTTRTATLHGFPDQADLHQVAFFGEEAHSSINSYGYSPFPLTKYLGWLGEIFLRSPARGGQQEKQLIVSITGSLPETEEMLRMLQRFAEEVGRVVAVEFNMSCPNIPGHPPPAYHQDALVEYLQMLAGHATPNLLMGIKLPPFTYQDQFEAVVNGLRSIGSSDAAQHPISFLTTTNTLGHGLVFAEQETAVPLDRASSDRPKTATRRETAVPSTLSVSDAASVPTVGGWGGVAGSTLHPLSLGNVAKLALLLRSEEQRDRRLREITIIGVGGARDAESVERFRRAGADAVACATALGREGPAVFAKMSGGQSRL
ncbi:hypothetical protein BMF94_6506 [Rhodotorula taiwanensis]|uniref:Uncharacterized protein n=1 Tax=Rhodotorula taiwanensis TaxID=741276 RepID=A0A2S5B0X9_9BASI|nr:hypothetical protein BMF94_6506 [Rhodotorula taiwanensis]